tara:strand:- start:273 stop:581 length:309 start_codon:yes stop_codon:yes gene_type:complete
MKKLILLVMLLCIFTPTILALESCEKDICFDKEQQNCLFLNLLPYIVLILISYVGIYFIFKNKIKNFSSSEKALWIISAFLIFVLINFILGKLYIFNKCLLQ